MNKRLKIIIIFQLIIIAAFVLDLLTTFRNLSTGQMFESHPLALSAPYIELAILSFGNIVFGLLSPDSPLGRIPQFSLFLVVYYPVLINEFNYYSMVKIF